MVTGLQKARGLGTPRSDIQRVATHYGISESEAERWLQIHPIEELVPARGVGLTRGTAAGIGNEVPPECPSLWPPLLVGMALGAVLGVGFAVVLSKGE